MSKKLCRHCGLRAVNRPRGLCWPCYYVPAIRDLYPVVSKFCRKGVRDFNGVAERPTAPTRARAGSPEKVAVLAERASLGQELRHPEDNPKIIDDTSNRGCDPGPRTKVR